MKKRNKMLLITSMVLAACGSLCLGRSLTTLPGKECPQTEQVEVKCYNKVVTEVANKI